MLGRDPVLDRNVWIHTEQLTEELKGRTSQTYKEVSRPTRLRWLQSSDDYSENGATERWSAFEAVDGVPFRIAAEKLENQVWPRASLWLEQLANELVESVQGNSLPETLTMDQVWVDEEDQLKLLNEPIEKIDPKSPQVFQQAEPVERALALFKSLLEVSIVGQSLTPTAKSLVEELPNRSRTIDTLVWLRESLAKINENPRTLSRLTRLSTLSISIGAESTVYSFMILFSMVFTCAILGLSIGASFLTVTGFWLGIAGVIGYFTKGGPAFLAGKLTLVNKQGKEVPRWRAMLRYLITWAPTIFFYCVATAFVAVALEYPEMGSDPANLPKEVLDMIRPLVLAFLVSIPLFLITLIGIAVCLISPRRGIQDLLTRTWLTHR